MAFNKLSVECEVLLNQLREVATDLGVDKSLIDAMSGPYTESTASEHPAAGCNASLHSPSYSSSEERFEVLKRAVQLSRGQVVAAGVKLHNMQSNLLKAALDHSKIMLAPSPPLAAHIMDTEVSQNGLDKEGNINETLSAITPCQTNQPKADQILPVAEKQIDTTPETREVSIQQSHHGRPLSTIGIIPQQDETSSEEDSGDDEGACLFKISNTCFQLIIQATFTMQGMVASPEGGQVCAVAYMLSHIYSCIPLTGNHASGSSH